MGQTKLLLFLGVLNKAVATACHIALNEMRK